MHVHAANIAFLPMQIVKLLLQCSITSQQIQLAYNKLNPRSSNQLKTKVMYNYYGYYGQFYPYYNYPFPMHYIQSPPVKREEDPKYVVRQPQNNGVLQLREDSTHQKQRKPIQPIPAKREPQEQPPVDTMAEIFAKIKELHSHRRPKLYWSQQEDKLLLHLVKNLQLQWNEIAEYHFPQRDYLACYRRYHLLLKSNPKRQNYQQQNEKLLALVQQYGQNWNQIKKHMPEFHPFQLRDRYMNILHPKLNHSPPTYEQDCEIIKFVLTEGTNWELLEERMKEGRRSKGWLKCRYYNRLHHIIAHILLKQSE